MNGMVTKHRIDESVVLFAANSSSPPYALAIIVVFPGIGIAFKIAKTEIINIFPSIGINFNNNTTTKGVAINRTKDSSYCVRLLNTSFKGYSLNFKPIISIDSGAVMPPTVSSVPCKKPGNGILAR